jgi:predicted membrane-bound spermidine synthase
MRRAVSTHEAGVPGHTPKRATGSPLSLRGEEGRSLVLRAVFLLSGAAALVFETLWFRLTRLAFGNSVTASAIVLASFMAGLALGNAAVAWRGPRVRRPILAYAGLEVVIGAAGMGLVLLLPVLPARLAPLLSAVPLGSTALEALRLVLSFSLLLLPATAMGATLPLLVAALSRSREDFGPALGSLYGWNTLGAVAGALGGEWVLIERLGVQGAGGTAALLDLLAAGGALWLSRGSVPEPAPAAPAPKPSTRARAVALGAAAALAGAILLGLEVVWFRFLQLFTFGTSRAFAAMLAVVVLGIALGGLAASRWLSLRPDAHRWCSLLALAAGLSAGVSYVAFEPVLASLGADYTASLGLLLAESTALMLPTCFASGLLFTLVGRALRDELDSASRAAGLLTVSNTVGAMFGSILAGFLLLPRLGVESSLFLLSFAYLGVSLAALPAARAEGRRRSALRLAFLGFGVLAAVFPFGLMKEAYLARVARRFSHDGSRLVAIREGQAETLLYMRKYVLGEPLACRLVTNGFSMSAQGFLTDRYMSLFVNWPLAVRPQTRRALLISYGVGTTAAALAREPSLEAIDVVDISRDVVEMSDLCVRPGAAHPLRDPRVRVLVEDGRFFLLTTRNRYDLITAEPPPPQAAGVESLYSREYFHLLRDRLVEGGVATYWVPAHSLDPRGILAVTRAFCDVFEDCTLWNGGGLNWMLGGTRGSASPVTAEDFTRQWRDPTLRRSLSDIGVEQPADLGGLFLGDAAFLGELARGAEPLVDDRPYRLSAGGPDIVPFRESLMEPEAARARFETSAWVARVWPEGLRRGQGAAFTKVGILNDHVLPSYGGRPRRQLATLQRALLQTSSVFLPLVVLGSQPAEQAIAARARARGESGALLDFIDATGALAARDYAGAARLLARVLEREPEFARAAALRALALCLAGDAEGFRAQPRPVSEPADREFWASVEPRCESGRPPTMRMLDAKDDPSRPR